MFGAADQQVGHIGICLIVDQRTAIDPGAMEAMRQGNLEMTWMQMGKAAPVDPWMMAVVGPGILTTVGAVRPETPTALTLVAE